MYINNIITCKIKRIIMFNKQGRMQDFSGGGGSNFKISWILDIHAAKRHVASSEAASLC